MANNQKVYYTDSDKSRYYFTKNDFLQYGENDWEDREKGGPIYELVKKEWEKRFACSEEEQKKLVEIPENFCNGCRGYIWDCITFESSEKYCRTCIHQGRYKQNKQNKPIDWETVCAFKAIIRYKNPKPIPNTS
jgi:hypothetical protein